MHILGIAIYVYSEWFSGGYITKIAIRKKNICEVKVFVQIWKENFMEL